MEDRILLTSGQFDPSFGYQGTVPLQYTPSDVVTYPDGRFLVSGTANKGAAPGAGDNYYEFFVQRYTSDGKLDPSFGAGGTALDGGYDFGSQVVLQPDGKIVGLTVNGGFQLVRFNPNGTLDSTFGTNGKSATVTISVNGQALGFNGTEIAVLPDGRFVVAGDVVSSSPTQGNVMTRCLALLRPDGTLDTSFNGSGTLLIPNEPGPVMPTIVGLAVQNNRLLVTSNIEGGLGEGLFLDRFNLDGSIDTTFGSAGSIGQQVQGYDATSLVQPDGKIVTAYLDLSTELSNSPEVMTRFNVDGTLDSSFGSAGKASLPKMFNGQYQGGHIAIQPDGKILIANDTNDPVQHYVHISPPQLVRLNTDGSIDHTYGNDGVATLSLPLVNPNNAISFLITIQPSGRALVASTSSDLSEYELSAVIGDPVVSFAGAASISDVGGTSTAEYSVSETASTATITLERGGDLTQTLSVPFSTDDSGGHAGVNYTSVHSTVTFAVGSATATVTIPILNDPNASPPVDVPLHLGTPAGGAVLGNVATGNLHIVPVEGIVLTPTQISSVMQGGSGSSFTVILTSVPTGNVTVPLSISGSSPAGVLSARSLVFTPANALTPQTVSVTAAGSSGGAGPASLATVALGPATSTDPKYSGLAGGSATVGVYANATGPGSIEFATPTYAANENAGTVTVTLVRLGGSTGSASVHFTTTDGTYGAHGKYTPLTGSINFAAGVTSKSITITLIDPGKNFQGDQTVDLALSNPTGGSQLGVFPTATLTLHDTSQHVAGDLDPTFGTGGQTILNYFGGASVGAGTSALVLQSDGKLVAAGTGGASISGAPLIHVWRTDAAGVPDASFGVNGVALVPFPSFGQIYGIAIGPDGKIVVVGTATRTAGGVGFALLRLNADGSLDTSFGTNGLVTASVSAGSDYPTAVYVDSDNSIVVAGRIDPAGDATAPPGFAHFNSDGSVDIGFGNGGAVVIPAALGANPVMRLPNGKWLLVGGGGYSQDSGTLPGLAARLDANFQLDPSFGTNGITPLSYGEFYASAALQADGKILIGGGEGANGGGAGTLGRLNADGTLDTTFGGGGFVLTPFSGSVTSLGSLIVQPNGKIVAIGYTAVAGSIGSYRTVEARYLPGGTLDPSFADGGSRSFSVSGDGNDGGQLALGLPGGRIALAVTADGFPVLAAILAPPGKAIPIITWPKPASIVYGTPLSANQLDATANVPGSFTYSPPLATIRNAGAGQTLSVTFTPSDTTDYTTALDTTQIDVTQATPTITWANPASIVHGTALSATQLDATASVAGTFVYSPALGTILPTGKQQTLMVSFTPNDSTDYITTTAKAAIDVTLGVPSITWANPTSIVYGTPLSATQLDATGNVPGTFTYSPALGTVLHAGSQQALGVTFTPSDTIDYNVVMSRVPLNVAQATPILTWAKPADIVSGTRLSATQLDATADVPGTFTYSPPMGTILAIGSAPLSVQFNPTDVVDYIAVRSINAINVTSKPPTTITWANPADIPQGTPLGAAQLDATAPVPGVFAYTPALGTILSAGEHQPLWVTFTPTDTARYTTAQSTVYINVTSAGPVIPTIYWGAPFDIFVGTRLSGMQLNATASVPGVFTYHPAAGTLLKAGAGQTLSVSFTPTDRVHYTPTKDSVLINVVTPQPPHIRAIDQVSRTKLGITAFTLGFNEAVVRESVIKPAQYRVLGGVTKNGKTVYTRVLAIKGIGFDGYGDVTLKLAQPYKGPIKATVHGGILSVTGARSRGDSSIVVV